MVDTEFEGKITNKEMKKINEVNVAFFTVEGVEEQLQLWENNNAKIDINKFKQGDEVAGKYYTKKKGQYTNNVITELKHFDNGGYDITNNVSATSLFDEKSGKSFKTLVENKRDYENKGAFYGMIFNNTFKWMIHKNYDLDQFNSEFDRFWVMALKKRKEKYGY